MVVIGQAPSFRHVNGKVEETEQWDGNALLHISGEKA